MAALFTKEKLKAILVNHNVAFPKDAKKGVYLDLYREHVQTKEGLEFSSDEDISFSISRTPTKRSKKKPLLPKKKSEESILVMNGTGLLDVSGLSDEDLLAQLKGLGANPGPILDSTRRVYEKKLQRLLDQNVRGDAVRSDSATPPPEEEFSDKDEPSEPELEPEPEPEPEPAPEPAPEPEPEPKAEPEPEPRQTLLRKRPPPVVTRQSPRRPTPVQRFESPLPAPPVPRPAPVQQPRDNEGEEDKDVYDGTVHSSIRPYRNGPTTATPNITVHATPPAQPAKRRRLPVSLQIVCFVLVAIAIYFVIQHLEPSAGKFLVGKLPGK